MRRILFRMACVSFLATASAAIAGNSVPGLQFIGQATFQTGYQVQGTNMGGLSGITYDSAAGTYYAISDDRSQFNPARFYTMTIDLSDNALSNGDVNFTGVTTLLNAGGNPFPATGIDPEGIAIAPNGGGVFVSSEGDATQLLAPFVNRFSFGGQQQQQLPVASRYLPTADQSSGIRNNLAFETLTIAPNNTSLFTATENALYQDGPAAGTSTGSPSRILRYDLTSGNAAQEYVYNVGPVIDTPTPPDAFATNGLVDMIALDDTNFIAMERSFSTGVGNRIRLYQVSVDNATDVSGIDSLLNYGGSITPAEKTLLLDLDTLGITLDNIEGITFGPVLPNGHRSVILVSDNNFSSTQFTQFLAFEVVPEPSVGMLFGVLALIGFRRR